MTQVILRVVNIKLNKYTILNTSALQADDVVLIIYYIKVVD